MEVRLPGKFEVSQDGKTIAITSRPAQSLFAYLILSAGTAHRREKLAGLLWPDSLEETARENLRHALWRLRKALASASSTRFLHTDDLSIRFAASAEYWLDAAAVTSLSVAGSDYYQRHLELRARAVGLNSDFALRHPEWAVSAQSAVVPVTGAAEASDYFQRHPELSMPAASMLDTADYFTRHPDLRTPAESDLSDYFWRH